MKTPIVYATLLAIAVVLLARCAEDGLFNQLTVVNGSGSGIYEMGQEVPVIADTPSAGMGFLRWTGDTTFLSDPASPTAVVTIPLQDMVVTATYAALPTYQLAVNNGTGSGSYLEGTNITITAVPPDSGDWLFVVWEGDLEYLNDETAETAIVTMPAQSVTVSATFEEANLISFKDDILPIFEARCIDGCHDGGGNEEPYTNYNQIRAKATDIKYFLETNYMPPAGEPLMPQSEKETYYLWVEQGKRNN
jgi:hypothetical protein